jgi:hypothetical protein
MQVGRMERTMSNGAYPSCGSSRSFSIGHLNIFFYSAIVLQFQLDVINLAMNKTSAIFQSSTEVMDCRVLNTQTTNRLCYTLLLKE